MKILIQKSLALALLIWIEAAEVYSQTDILKWELGTGIGNFIYQGDLTPSRLGSWRTQKLVMNFFVTRVLNNSFSLRGNLAIGKLKGDDAKYSNPEYRQQRNFNFKSPVIEVSGQLVWNPLGKNYYSKGLTPYLFGGIGLSFFNIKRDWSKFNSEYFSNASSVLNGLAADQQHKIPGLLPVIPVGIGIRYALTQRISINAETTYRILSTDYLDGFSHAADPTKKDNYYSNTIGIIYRLGTKNKLNCPVVPR